MARTPMLSTRQLTVSFLARQLLLRRTSVSAAHAVKRLVALQAQYSLSPHIALHARLDGFRTADLDRAISTGRVLKTTLMRGTLHLVHSTDYGAFASAWGVQGATIIRGKNPAARAQEPALVTALTRYLDQPRSTDEIRAFVADIAGDLVKTESRLDYARLLLPLVHVPPSGMWRRHGKFSLIRWQQELPGSNHGTQHLVRAYLGAFGPATRQDIATFTWLTLGQIDSALAALEPLRRYTDDAGRDLLDLPRAPLTGEDVATPTRFLAKWDAALLSHKDRTRILPTELHTAVFGSQNGEVPPTYLVDGLVAGLWSDSIAEGTATLTLNPLTPAPPPVDLEPEALRLLRLLHPEASQCDIKIGGR
jgi:hypothetical protein